MCVCVNRYLAMSEFLHIDRIWTKNSQEMHLHRQIDGLIFDDWKISNATTNWSLSFSERRFVVRIVYAINVLSVLNIAGAAKLYIYMYEVYVIYDGQLCIARRILCEPGTSTSEI